MIGAITYTDESIISPSYPRMISIGGKKYPSASAAIDDGNDPMNTMLLWVRDHRDIYMSYRQYNLSGTHSQYLQDAIRMLLMEHNEHDTSGMHVMLLSPEEYPKVAVMPSDMSIPVRRHVYSLSPVKDMANIWLQLGPIDAYDTYEVFMLKGNFLYRHPHTLKGFLLLGSINQDTTSTLAALR